MIATNEALDVLRHGWQDAASTLAADVPEVAELLRARLELAISSERLDEEHLLDTIQEVESVTSRAGSPSSQALARRLRRTVYEYLLALDAARPSETAAPVVDQPSSVPGSAMVGAEEVAALGHASRSRTGETADVPPPAIDPVEATTPAFDTTDGAAATDAGTLDLDEAVDDPASDATPASRRRFALRRRQRRPADPATSNADDAEAIASDAPEAAETAGPATETAEPATETADLAPEPVVEAEAADVPPWQFNPTEEPVAASTVTDADPVPDATALGDVPPADDAAPLALDPEATVEAAFEVAPPDPDVTAEVAAADPSAETEPLASGDVTVEPGFVAPRAGFHIVEDAPAHRSSVEEEPRLEMPVFSADEPAPAQPSPQADPSSTDQPGSEFLAWRPTETSVEAAPEVATPVTPSEAAAPQPASPPAPVQPVPVQPAPAAFTPEVQMPAQPAQPAPAPTRPAPELVTPAPAQHVPQFDTSPGEGGDAEQRSWGVRRHGEARSSRPGAPSVTAAPVEDDPFENNSALSEIRRRIEDRLRRKRCDEAAALLQELAQSTGGRAVADLAMNAGDRCRALGKSNAALNCYLAAARSDPVYEKPLGRLADICIDNQDTELAVSYLERIARQHRFRGEDKDALRVYRRIAAIAPYREDVLNMLMNAQRTGQLE